MTSTLVLGGVGILLNFLPQEATVALAMAPSPGATALIQVLASALLGMGIMNWMSRTNPMGGIYGRPLALGNFLLFGASALALLRASVRLDAPRLIQGGAVVAGVLAIGFGWVIFFGDPVSEAQKNTPSQTQ